MHYKNIRQLWSIWLIENQFNSTGYDCFLRKVVPEVCRTDEQNHAREVEGTGVPALAVPVNLYNNLYIGGRLDALAVTVNLYNNLYIGGRLDALAGFIY